MAAFGLRGEAATSLPEDPYKVVLDRPTPPVPIDPVDIAARSGLGDAVRWWGFVGSFELSDKGGRKLVAVYYSDSDLNEWGMEGYPNFFTLYAATRDGQGRWISQNVYSCTRCHFGRVLGCDGSSVTVQLQPRWNVPVSSRDTSEEQEGWRRVAEEANNPFSVILSVRDGRVVASRLKNR